MNMPTRLYGVAAAWALAHAAAANAAPVSLGLGRIEQITITVKDIASAEAFYEGTLGLRKLFAQRNLLIFDAGGQRLLVGTAENGEEPSASTTLYFRCTDLAACIAQLEERGVQFVAEPELVTRTAAYDLWLAFFRDPDGNSLALIAEAPLGFDPAKRTLAH
jgi:predicted enzyme related to lactoylglutathione lyase